MADNINSNKASQFISTYTSFSGADLVVTFANQVIGELQQISYAIEREKVPVFTLGSPNPRSFSRGKRGIAGSLVIAQFDHDALMKAMKDIWSQIAPKAMFTAAGNTAAAKSENFAAAMSLLEWNKEAEKRSFNLQTVDKDGNIKNEVKDIYGTGSELFGFGYLNQNQLANNTTNEIGNINKNADSIVTPPGFTTINAANLQYADQCPPFDVTLTFANEYGQCAFMKIYDLELLNEASGVSVDSVVMEKRYTWIARNISPLYRGIYTRSADGKIENINTQGTKISDNT